MNGIVAMTHVLRQTELNEEQHDCVNTILDSSGAMLTLLNDLLDAARIEAGKFSLHPTPFKLNRLWKHVDDVMTTRLKHARQRGEKDSLIWQLNIDDSVPAIIVADLGRLRQILLNLCDNALKFTTQGSITLAMRVVKREEMHEYERASSDEHERERDREKHESESESRMSSSESAVRARSVEHSDSERETENKARDEFVSILVRPEKRKTTHEGEGKEKEKEKKEGKVGESKTGVEGSLLQRPPYTNRSPLPGQYIVTLRMSVKDTGKCSACMTSCVAHAIHHQWQTTPSPMHSFTHGDMYSRVQLPSLVLPLFF